jgi:hypothetical protein
MINSTFNPAFNPDNVAVRILVDSDGEIEVEAINIGELPEDPNGVDLRTFGATTSITKQVQIDVHKKNPTVIRVYYIATDGSKKYKDIVIP